MNRYIIVFSAILALGGTTVVSADETGMGKTSPTATMLVVNDEEIQDETGMGFTTQTTDETGTGCSLVSTWLGLCQRTK